MKMELIPLKLKWIILQGIGTNKPTFQFESNDVDNNIYIIVDYDTGWNSAEIEILEVSERTLP